MKPAPPVTRQSVPGRVPVRELGARSRLATPFFGAGLPYVSGESPTFGRRLHAFARHRDQPRVELDGVMLCTGAHVRATPLVRRDCGSRPSRVAQHRGQSVRIAVALVENQRDVTWNGGRNGGRDIEDAHRGHAAALQRRLASCEHEPGGGRQPSWRSPMGVDPAWAARPVSEIRERSIPYTQSTTRAPARPPRGPVPALCAAPRKPRRREVAPRHAPRAAHPPVLSQGVGQPHAVPVLDGEPPAASARRTSRPASTPRQPSSQPPSGTESK